MPPEEHRQILAESARAFLAKEAPLDALRAAESDPAYFDDKLWARIAELGWLALGAPSLGVGELPDLEVLCEEFGRALCPAPFLAVAVAGGALLERDGSEASCGLLEALCDGHARPVPALLDAAGEWGADGEVRAEGDRITGRRHYVESAAGADRFLVLARREDGEDRLFVVPRTDGAVKVSPLRAIAGHHLCDVAFEGAPGDALATGLESVDAAMSRVAAMQAAWCAGAAGRLLEDTVAYVSERRQFGVPIGSFQAVQHSLADCSIAVAEAESLARRAADALHRQAPYARRLASTAFVRATDAMVEVARRCHQAWGGLGFSTEMHVHHFSRRAKAAQNAWGGTRQHLEIVAEELRKAELVRDRYQRRLRG